VKGTLVILGITAVCLVIFLGCDSLVNRLSFFPDTTFLIPVDELPPSVREVFIRAPDGIRLQCYHIPRSGSERILIYFHGNAGNVGHRLPDLLRLSSYGIHILALSYRGYGKSEGKPSEKGIYLDGKTAVAYAAEDLGFLREQIVLMGRSIGASVAVDAAQHMDLAGLILVTPLTTGKDYARSHGFGPISALAGKSFDNMAKMPDIRCPSLIVHGTRDRVIPFDMGRRIYDSANVDKTFVPIEGADHNNLSDESEYWEAISGFVGAAASRDS